MKTSTIRRARALLTAATVGSAAALSAFPAGAQALKDLAHDAATPGDVVTYGMGWGQQRYSALTQIDKQSVKRLVPVWNLSLDNSANASTQPLVIDGVMYVATHTHTIAIDAVSGRQRWKTPTDVPADVTGFLCCGVHSRGMAVRDGILYRTQVDANVVALDMKDGKVLWKQKVADY